jgi:hypothetical protein
MSVAFLGTQLADIRFLNPSTEFPTEATCQCSAARVRLDFTHAGQQVATACGPHQSRF